MKQFLKFISMAALAACGINSHVDPPHGDGTTVTGEGGATVSVTDSTSVVGEGGAGGMTSTTSTGGTTQVTAVTGAGGESITAGSDDASSQVASGSTASGSGQGGSTSDDCDDDKHHPKDCEQKLHCCMDGCKALVYNKEKHVACVHLCEEAHKECVHHREDD